MDGEEKFRMFSVGNKIVKYAFCSDESGNRIKIGEGTFGSLYSAKNPDTGQLLAIKELHVSGERGGKIMGEVNIHSKLSHRNIVPYIGCTYENGCLRILMELVRGGNLSQLLQKEGGFGDVRLQIYSLQTLRGLAYLHSKGIVHRDIKGSNILVNDSGVIKIADFGLSLDMQDATEHVGQAGTRSYMAPEVLASPVGYSKKSDVWSFGCTFIEMKTGKPPRRREKNDGAAQHPSIPQDLSEDATNFLLSCFRLNPDDRPSAEDLLQHTYLKDTPEVYASLYTSPSVRHRSWMKRSSAWFRQTSKDDSCVSSATYFRSDVATGNGSCPSDDEGCSMPVSPLSRKNAVRRLSSKSLDEQAGARKVTLNARSRSDVGERAAICRSIIDNDDRLAPPSRSFQRDQAAGRASRYGSSYDDSGIEYSWSRSAERKQMSREFPMASTEAKQRTWVEFRSASRLPCASGIKVRSDLLPSPQTVAVERQQTFFPSASEIKALVHGGIPGLRRQHDALSLARLVYDSPCICVKVTALSHLLDVLYRCGNFSLSALLPVEYTLRPCDRKDAFELPLEVLEPLCHSYVTVVCLIYMSLLLGGKYVGELDEMRLAAPSVYELFDRIISDKCKKTGQSADAFIYMKAFLQEALTRRIAVWRTASRKPSLKSKYNHVQSAQVLRNIISALKETTDTTNKLKDHLYTSITGVRTWFERTLFLHYIAAQVTATDGRFTVVKRVIACMTSQKLKEWFPVVIGYLYIRVLNRERTTDVCQAILQSSGEEMGFAEFLQFVHNSPKLKNSLWALMTQCACLILHPCSLVRESVQKYMSQTARKRSLVDEHLRHISSALSNIFQARPVHTDENEEIRRYLTTILKGFCPQLERPKSCKEGELQLEGRFYDTRSVLVKVATLTNKTASPTPEKPVVLKEIRTLLKLNETGSNPKILEPLFYQGYAQPYFYVAQSLHNCQSLHKVLIQLRGQQSLVTLHCLLKQLVQPVLSVVHFCHARGVLLRNLTSHSFRVQQRENLQFQVQLQALNMAEELPEEEKFVEGSKHDPVPLLWAAPESLILLQYSPSSDVYMAAHTVLEILSLGCQPYSSLEGLEPEQLITEVLTHGIKPVCPAYVPTCLCQQLSACLITEPARRGDLEPLMETVKAMIQSHTHSVAATAESVVEAPALNAACQEPPCLGIPSSLQNLKSITNLRRQNAEDVALDFGEEVNCDPAELQCEDDPQLVRGPFDSSSQIQALCPKVSRKLAKMPLLDDIDGRHQKLLPALQHDNLVKVLGIVTEDVAPSYRVSFLVTEWLESVNLFDSARKMDPNREDFNICIEWCTQVAEGMAYLHEKGIIHCHLRAKYVYLHIVGDEVTAKIGQLGRSKLLTRGRYDHDIREAVVYVHKAQLRPSRWAPREVNEQGVFSMRSDVASWGLLVWEVHRARSLEPDVDPVCAVPYAHLTANQLVREQCRHRALPQCRGCPDWLYVLIQLCLIQPSHRRPLFPDIVVCLRAIEPEKHELVTGCVSSTKGDPFSYDDQIYDYWVAGTIRQRNKRKRSLRVRQSVVSRACSVAEESLFQRLQRRIYTPARPHRHVQAVYEEPIPVQEAPRTPADELANVPLSNVPFGDGTSSIYEDMRMSKHVYYQDVPYTPTSPVAAPMVRSEMEGTYVTYNPPGIPPGGAGAPCMAEACAGGAPGPTDLHAISEDLSEECRDSGYKTSRNTCVSNVLRYTRLEDTQPANAPSRGPEAFPLPSPNRPLPAPPLPSPRGSGSSGSQAKDKDCKL